MIRLFVLFLCLSASLKNDQELMASSEFLSGITTMPAVTYLKSASSAELGIAFLIGIAIIFRAAHLQLRRNAVATTLLVLTAYSCARAFAFNPVDGLKLFQGFVILAFITVVIQTAIANATRGGTTQEIARGLRLFAAVFIAVNFANYALGYGYSPVQPRFFGTAVHPNFLGVQLAACNLLLISGFPASSRRLSMVLACTILPGIWMQLLTGSRSSLLMLVVGVTTLVYLRTRRKAVLILLGGPILVAAVAAISIVASGALSSVFTRGSEGQDTRSQAWGEMLASIVSNPFLGKGYFVGASENSVLRAMAAFGIPFGLVFLMLLVFASYKLYRSSRISPAAAGPFFALSLSLLAASIFEGYLMDTWSLPKLLLILIFATCARASFAREKTPATPLPHAPEPLET